MKRNILLLSIVLILLLSIMSVPMVFAKADEDMVSISINEVESDLRIIDLRNKNSSKTVDMFVGDSIKVKTDILISKDIIIENINGIRANYTIDESFGQSIKVDDYSSQNGNNYLKRETNTLTASKVGSYTLVASYTLSGVQYFDYININVFDKDIKDMVLKPNVTTVKTNSHVDFDLIINGSNTLSVTGKIDYYINDEQIFTLDNYTIGSDVKPLNVKIVYTDLETATSKTIESKIPVVKANSLTQIMTSKSSYGYMLKSEKGIIPLYVTKGSYPNISLNAKTVTYEGAKLVDSDKEGYDKYELTIKFPKFNSDKQSEDIMIIADDKSTLANISVINSITSISIVPDDTKFESGKASTFHIVINGVKDVETPVKWTVNGTEMKTTNNTLEYKALSSNKITISATVNDNAIAEYTYEIDTSTSSIILTCVVSLIVIIICIPILIAIKKSPKPNLKAMIKKDNKTTIALLEKLKTELMDDTNKQTLKHILKINTMITRSEKRAQQESFECENKAFASALSSLSDAKEIINELTTSWKNNSKDTNINKINTIISCLESSNITIEKVEENM